MLRDTEGVVFWETAEVFTVKKPTKEKNLIELQSWPLLIGRGNYAEVQ